MTCKTKLVKGHFIPARWRASKISEKANTAHFCAGGAGGGERETHPIFQSKMSLIFPALSHITRHWEPFPEAFTGIPSEGGMQSLRGRKIQWPGRSSDFPHVLPSPVPALVS